MSPRPPKRGVTAVTAGPAKPVEVVRRRGPRPIESPSAPLPAAVLAALAAIVRDMRDLPRDCLVDQAELVHWLRRMAGRVEGVGRMRVVAALPSPVRAVAPPAAQSAFQRDLAEAEFGKGPVIGRVPGPRVITNHRGKTVRIKVRRARTAGQMELGL